MEEKEKKDLVIRYARLVAELSRSQENKVTLASELEELRRKLNMSHEGIIEIAEDIALKRF